jgi:HNH endonuclease
VFLIWGEDIAPELRQRMKTDEGILGEAYADEEESEEALEAAHAERRASGDGKISLRIRAIVAYGQVCAYCSRKGTALLGPDGKAWHLDRIHPGALGGEYVPENVVLSCQACNLRKSDSLLRVVVRSRLEQETGADGGTDSDASKDRLVRLTATERDWLVEVVTEGAHWSITPSEVVAVALDVWAERNPTHRAKPAKITYRTLLRLTEREWERLRLLTLQPDMPGSESTIIRSALSGLMEIDVCSVASGTADNCGRLDEDAA